MRNTDLSRFLVSLIATVELAIAITGYCCILSSFIPLIFLSDMEANHYLWIALLTGFLLGNIVFFFIPLKVIRSLAQRHLDNFFAVILIVGCLALLLFFVGLASSFIAKIVLALAFSMFIIALGLHATILMLTAVKDSVVILYAISIVCGSALCFLLQGLSATQQIVFGAILALVIITSLYISKDCIYLNLKRQEANFSNSSPMLPVSSGAFLFGFVFGVITRLEIELLGINENAVLWIILSLVLPTLLFIVMSFFFVNKSLYRLPQWFYFICTAFLLLAIQQFDGTIRLVLCLLCNSIFVLYNATNVYIIIAQTRSMSLPLYKTLTFNRAMGTLGTVVSFLAVSLMYEFIDNESLPVIIATYFTSMTVLVMFLIVTRVSLNKWMDKKINTNLSVVGEVGGSKWKECCNTICKRYDLTSREREVFQLLSRGRTAKFIEQDLNISYATAKSHVHHIYSKLDVHSHQELINLIEIEYQGKTE